MCKVASYIAAAKLGGDRFSCPVEAANAVCAALAAKTLDPSDGYVIALAAKRTPVGGHARAARLHAAADALVERATDILAEQLSR